VCGRVRDWGGYERGLPSARDLALGKPLFCFFSFSKTETTMCVGPVKLFAECPSYDTRQTIGLPSVSPWHSANPFYFFPISKS